jgi:single-strand DNA-binding protein
MVNKVILLGNVGRDPEVRSTGNGQSVASFSLATSRRWKDRDGNKQEQTEWHNVVAWGKLADVVAKYVTKGLRVFIEGRIETKSWDDKTSGEKRYKTQIVAENLTMLGERKGNVENDARGRGDAHEDAAGGDFDDSDIPF